MSAADRFAEFRQEKESADKEQTSRSSTNRPVNFGDYETSLTRIQELLQKHELEHEFKNKNGESIFELQRCPENEQHSRGEAFVKVSSAGDVTAGCQHNSCKWGFPSFFKKLEGSWPSGPQGPVFETPVNGPAWLNFDQKTGKAAILQHQAASDFRETYPTLDLDDPVAVNTLQQFLRELAPQVNFTHLDLQNILKLGRIQLGEEPWSVDPIPLVKVMQEERAYPLSALPSNQQAQIKELCELVKVPTTLAAQSLQAAISCAAQGLVNVVRRVDHDELVGPVNTAHLTLAEPSERKSSVDDKLMVFLSEQERELREKYSQEYRKLAGQYDQWQQKYQDRQAAVAKIQRQPELKEEDHGKIDKINRELMEMKETEPLQPPSREANYLPYLSSRNFSIQALAQLLSRYPSMIINSAEGGQTLGSFAFQKDNLLNTLADLNELIWKGAVRNNRVGDTGVDVENARLTVNLMIQPEAAIDLFTNPLYRGTGMLARFCVAHPVSIAGTRFVDVTKALNGNHSLPKHLNRLTRQLRQLLQAVQLDSDRQLVLKPLRMSRDGLALWLEYYNQVEKELGEQGIFQDHKDIAGKTAEIAARLAAQFHLVNVGPEGEISAEFVLSAVELARWYLHEFLRVSGVAQDDRAFRNATKLLNWLKTHERAEEFRRGHTMELRTLQNHGVRPPCKDKEQLMEALTLLERNHFLRFDERTRRIKGHPKEFCAN